MPRTRTHFVCQSCGYRSGKSLGRCPECGQWNCFVEETVRRDERPVTSPDRILNALKNVDSSALVDLSEGPQSLAAIDGAEDHRVSTTIPELDRVLGGGIVQGSLVLVGGEPGIGKSTLMLQMAARVALKALYVSGEESARQIKVRAERIAHGAGSMRVLAETNLNKIARAILEERPEIVVIDSVQTLYRDEIESAPGSVSQVRESAALLMQLAKSQSISVFLVGHVTKDGMIAGPKVLEHIVDTVLQFEGDPQYLFRILRAVKNRFGSTNEIGIFEMREQGLIEVANPSELFLSERYAHQSGSVVVPVVEGSRVLLVEVQALVSPSAFGMPQRTTSGFDHRRLQLLIAVLEKRAHVPLGQSDVFLNIAGGLRVDEPALDLGVAVAMVSSVREIALDPSAVVMGEIGLGGEIRAVSHAERRVREAVKLGFEKVILPRSNQKDCAAVSRVECIPVRHIGEAVAALERAG